MKKIDRLCEYMRKLQHELNVERSSLNEVDKLISNSARIRLLEMLLQEAAFIKKEKGIKNGKSSKEVYSVNSL
jgi:hypothetical protein